MSDEVWTLFGNYGQDSRTNGVENAMNLGWRWFYWEEQCCYFMHEGVFVLQLSFNGWL